MSANVAYLQDSQVLDQLQGLFDAQHRAYAANPMQALDKADALVIVTEWKEFRSPDFEAIKAALKTPTIFDGRNLYDPKLVRGIGLDYQAIGR